MSELGMCNWCRERAVTSVNGVAACVAHIDEAFAAVRAARDLAMDFRRLSSLRRLAPGVLVDEATGTLHLDLPAMLEHAGYEDNEANRQRLVDVARDIWPSVEVEE